MIRTAMWLFLLGLLGVLRPFVVRREAKWPRWVLYGGQIVLGLNSCLWGLWGLIQTANTLRFLTVAPLYWTATLLGSLLDLGLPALFVATMLAPALGKGDEAQKNRSARTLSFAQAAAGGVAILVAIGMVALDLGVAAP